VEAPQGNANQLVRIDDDCDEHGTNEDNLALGERRAKAAMQLPRVQGHPRGSDYRGPYGNERPVCTEHNESC